MPPPEVWGPPIWTFFHVLAEKIRDCEFPRIYTQLFGLIQRICALLPCPDCSQHAISFLKKIKINDMNTKDKFKGMLYVFHNYVNLRKRKKLFNYENLVNYRKIKIGTAFNNFVYVYNTRGNMKMLSESFQRSLLLKDLRKWLMYNFFAFDDSSNNIIQQSTNIITKEEIIEDNDVEKVVTKDFVSQENSIVENSVTEEVVSQENSIVENSVTEEVVTEEVVTEEQVIEKSILEEPYIEEKQERVEEKLAEEHVCENKVIAEENIISAEETNNLSHKYSEE
jgi:hypothetical protein